MTEERVFIFRDLDNKKDYKLSYRAMIAMVFAAEQFDIWYRNSEMVNGHRVDRFMKVKGEVVEMYDINENLLSSSHI